MNALLQHKFGFHRISKLVVRLGPKEGQKDYHEGFGVAHKYYPNFDTIIYKSLSPEGKRSVMRNIVLEVFDWLISNFEDAQCFEKAKRDLGWAETKTKTKPKQANKNETGA